MPLSLLAGPANAGKVALLLERYLGALDSDPILIVPNRPDVDRAERELLTRAGALVGGSIGTFDDLFERIAQRQRRAPARDQRRRSGRSCCGASSPGPRAASARFAGFRGRARLDGRRARVRPARARRARRRARRRSTAPTATELDRLGLWDRDLERRHAAERRRGRPRRLGAAAGVRVRVRGPDRRRVGAARGARRARGGHGLAAVRARTRRLRVARRARPRTSRALAGRADRGAAAEPRAPARPALAHLERALFGDERDAGAGARTARCASSRAPAPAARSSSSRDEILALLRDGTPADEIAIVCPVARPLARAARDGLQRRSASPTRSRARLRLGADAVRAGARSRCSATRGSTGSGASSSRSSARRTRACRATTSTSSRAGCAAAA